MPSVKVLNLTFNGASHTDTAGLADQLAWIFPDIHAVTIYCNFGCKQCGYSYNNLQEPYTLKCLKMFLEPFRGLWPNARSKLLIASNVPVALLRHIPGQVKSWTFDELLLPQSDDL